MSGLRRYSDPALRSSPRRGDRRGASFVPARRGSDEPERGVDAVVGCDMGMRGGFPEILSLSFVRANDAFTPAEKDSGEFARASRSIVRGLPL